MEVAAGIVAGEGLVPLAGPFDRSADLLRRPGDQRELGIEGVAGAEIAADLVGDHPHLVGVDAEDDRDLLLGPHDGAAAGMDRVAARRGIVGA